MSVQLKHHAQEKVNKKPLAKVREEELNVARPRKKKAIDRRTLCVVTALTYRNVYSSDIKKEPKMSVGSTSTVARHMKKNKAEKEEQDPENAAGLPLSSEIFNTPDVSV